LDIEVLNQMGFITEETIAFIEAVSIVSVETGIAAYAVGGFVRELFLGEKNEDIDITVEGDAIQFAKQVARLLNLTNVQTHPQFQTASVQAPSEGWIDIVTARSEYYPYPGALPVVKSSNITEDLRRRDFTFNAMAIPIRERKMLPLVDPFSGLKDLQKGLIRIMHPKSFHDDPTRIFRAVRYQTRLNFQLEAETKEAMQTALKANVLETISSDRIRNELIAILHEQCPNNALRLLDEWNILKYIHPGLTAVHAYNGLISQIQSSLTQFALLIPFYKIVSWEVYLLGLISILQPDDAQNFLERYHFPRSVQNKIDELRVVQERDLINILEQHDHLKPSRLVELLDGLSKETLLWLMAKVSTPQARFHISLYLRTLRHVKPQINGHTLLKMGMKPGKAVGDVLRAIRKEKLDGRLITFDDEKTYAKKWIDTYLTDGT